MPPTRPRTSRSPTATSSRVRAAPSSAAPLPATIVFVASSPRADRAVHISAYIVDPVTAELHKLDVPTDLSEEVKSFFSHDDGTAPPLVVVSPPPPPGPTGDELFARVARRLR